MAVLLPVGEPFGEQPWPARRPRYVLISVSSRVLAQQQQALPRVRGPSALRAQAMSPSKRVRSSRPSAGVSVPESPAGSAGASAAAAGATGGAADEADEPASSIEDDIFGADRAGFW
jgi:hypothetical protein